MRKLLAGTAAAVTVICLAGCGFRLRGEAAGSAPDAAVQITGIGQGNPFYADFVQELSNSGGRLAQKRDQARAIVNVQLARHERRALTLSSQGRANTFDLNFRLVYSIQSPTGETLVPQQELEIRRDYFNDQSSPLGQGEEEAQMRLEMEKEAARALYRRVVFSLRKKTASRS
jgi:LPS-assembly lipoprotein